MLGKTAGAKAPSYSPMTFRRGSVGAAFFAPDGKTILYSAAWEGGPTEEVFVGNAGSTEARPLGARGRVAGVVQEEVAVYSNDGTLVKVPLGGGVPDLS